jgi:AcrR family transcriptional regulator
MPRAGLSARTVVDAAIEVLDEQGPDGLTLAGVATRVGVAAPSLYKHVQGLPELRTLVGIRVMEELSEHLTLAVLGRGGDEAIAALMHACRDYVLRHPARYAAMPVQPLDDPAMAAAGTRLLNVFLAVLRSHDLTGPAAIHATRCLRAIVHGFATIEAAGGFGLPEEIDETYEWLIRMFLTNLTSPPGKPSPPANR